MAKAIKLTIANVEAELPILTQENGVEHIVFSLFGNQVLAEACAQEMLHFVKGCDVILTTEETGLLLGHCLSRLLKQPRYAVAKRTKEMYILEGISISIRSKHDAKLQNLRLSSFDTALIKGKKVAIVDATVETGGILDGLETLVRRAGGRVASRVFVLASEKCRLSRTDIECLQIMPTLD